MKAPATALDAGGTTTVTATLGNISDKAVTGLTASIAVPEGWRAVPTGPALRPQLDAGAEQAISWQVTAPAPITAPVARAAVTASVGLRAGRTRYELTRTLDVTAVNPLTSLAGYGSVPSLFGEAGGGYVILTSGADIWQDGGGAFDEYGTIYHNDAAATSSTVTARVTAMDNTNPWAKAGVAIRNDLTGAGASPGYAVMVVTAGNGVAFQWDADGNGYLDSSAGAGGVTAPAWVRLVRSGGEVSGYYSTDGSSWTKVGPTVSLAGIAETQDAGLIATSHATGVTGQFGFSDLTVTP